MSESFRPHESSSIDAGLRTRLEGSVELLEDALPLLDSLMYLLARVETSRDDVATLQECVTQLPRIDEAVDKLNRHEQAHTLTVAVASRKKAALLAANERLLALGHDEVESLRGAVAAVLDLVRRQGTAPRPGEHELAHAKSAPVLLSLALGVVAAWAAFAVLGSAWAGLLGVLAGLAALRALSPKPWVLLPDRLYLPARGAGLAREVLPSSIRGIARDGDQVSVQLADETLELHCESPEKLVSLLHLLKGPWLAQLESPPQKATVLEAMTEETKERGRALVSAEGLLFIPAARVDLAVKALCAEKLTAPPSIEELLVLIGHLPEGRWAALGDHLVKTADARWFPRGEVIVEESANAHLGATLRCGEQRVRVSFGKAQLEAEAVISRLKAEAPHPGPLPASQGEGER
ncbi:MAG: hypothetical protein Q8L48_41320 [Archangium sp.]|nr:hypothetical protein [Archangium sp.]